MTESPVPHPQPAARPGVVLAGHVLFTLLNSLLFANTVWLMPLLVRLYFGATDPRWKDWQTTLITAAVPTFMMSSIFWNDLLRRVSLRNYLCIYWLTAVLPLGCLALAQNYWQLLACHVVATAGLAGWTPLNGKLLKHFYSDAVRGRAYALLNVVTLASGIAAVYFVGQWVEADATAFRMYFPVAAAIQLVAVAILMWLVRLTGAEHELLPRRPPSWAALLRPVLHMREVLRADRTFLHYETAFMTYGAAFMLCDALLPVLATDRLHMRYEDYAHYTQVVLRAGALIAMLPMGWLLDRLGPVRTSGFAFAVLGLYPLLLIVATLAAGPGGADAGTWTSATVVVACLVYGVAMAGVQMGWMLGPVTLAGSTDKVPQYVAIHATLVGVRGILFQGLGMLLYQLTGSFAWPLALAVLAFAWAALQMRRLHGLMQPVRPAVSPDRASAATVEALD